MEVHAIIQLGIDAWENKNIGILHLTTDDDSTIHSNLQHSWTLKVQEGQMTMDEWPRTEKGYKKETTMEDYHSTYHHLSIAPIQSTERK